VSPIQGHPQFHMQSLHRI